MGQDIQACIDGLGRQLLSPIVWIRASEASRNLLGRAALRQMGSDVLLQPWVQKFAGSPRVTGSTGRQRVGGAGPIRLTEGRVAGIFPAQGAGCAAQHSGHNPQRMTSGQSQAHGLTFVGTQVSVASCCHGNTIAHRSLQCCTWR